MEDNQSLVLVHNEVQKVLAGNFDELDYQLVKIENRQETYEKALVIAQASKNEIQKRLDVMKESEKFDIKFYEGINPRVKELFRLRADINDWMRLFDYLKDDDSQVPQFDFSFHLVRRYALNYLLPEYALQYLRAVRALFIRNVGIIGEANKYIVFTQDAYDNFLSQVNELIKTIKDEVQSGH